MNPKKVTFLMLVFVTLVAVIVLFVPIQVYSYQTCAVKLFPERISIIKGESMDEIKDKIEVQQTKEAAMDCPVINYSVKQYIL